MVVGVALLCAIVFVTPLAVGSVHRPALLLVTSLSAVALGLFLAAETLRGGSLRVTKAVVLPLALVLIPFLQSVPLPSAIPRRLDPAGDALLVESPDHKSAFRSLSLDPTETRAIVGKMGAALIVFVLAFHLSSGRSWRQLLLTVVAASAVTAFVIGLGHRILGEEKIFGTFQGSRGLLNGPFINPNHMAELMELGAFVCVACALTRPSALNRVGWFSAAAMLGAGALGTLSRGAVLGLGSGTLLFAALKKTAPGAPGDGSQLSRRGTMFWIGMLLLMLTVVSLILGTESVLSRMGTTRISQELRLQLWRNTLQILWAHPFGIGRGAFEHVFPVYRTVEAPLAVSFTFVENEPLQYLVEMGWVGFAGLVAAAVFVAYTAFRARRRDPVEAALAAALVAVLIHNVVDFGLETLGILIPFAAVLGALLGRTRDIGARTWPRPRVFAVCAAAAAAIGIGAGSSALASADDFDVLLKKAGTANARRAIALRAEAAHPVDYFYVLSQAYSEAIVPPERGTPSPRLHILNHALLLCPRCAEVHVAVARTLWALGKRNQALVEWRTAIDTRPELFEPTLQELWTSGGRPDDVAALPASNPDRLITTISFLAARNQRADARKLLPRAIEAGAARPEALLTEARLDIDDGLTDQALAAITAARRLSPQDPRIFLLQAEAHVRADAADKALEDLEAGIAMNPENLPLQRMRVQVIMQYRKWHLAEGALAGLEGALHQAQQSTVEFHLASARLHVALHEYVKASREYQLVLTQDHDNAGVWLELGSVFESAGREVSALEAYREAHRIAPTDAAVAAAVARIEDHRRQLRLEATSP